MVKYNRDMTRGDEIMGFKSHIQSEKRSMDKFLKRLEKNASVLPDTKLYMKNDGKRKRYYITTAEEPRPTYIGWRNQPELLRQLLDREHARKNVLRVQENLQRLDQLIEEYGFSEDAFPAEEGYIGRRGQRPLPPSQNPFKREELIHDTGLGFYARTKSKAIVARRLHTFGWRFQYEKELRIRDLDGRWKSIYPDFTIWLDDGRVIYLEHVGMLQKDDYQQNFVNRMATYHKNDMLIGRDVFITMDGPAGDIDIPSIDAVIRGFDLL